MVLGSAKDIAVIRDGVKKLVDEARTTNQKVSPDVYLTISRSLVAAIDAKQTQNLRVKLATQQLRQKIDTKNTEQEKREVFAELERFKAEQEDEAILRLSEDYEKGAILVFYFADQLKGVENSGFDIAASMREMLLSFDPAKETGRYASFADARKRAIAARESRRAGGTETILVENPVTTRLIEIDKMITAKKLAEASKALRELVDKDPADARIYYNIGRVASQLAADLADPGEEDQLRATLLEAKVAYENVIRIAAARRTDAALVSLSYVALARIYEFFGDTTYAVGIYDAAIKVGDVTGGAYKEALAGKARLLRDQ
ncbi:hypothetical protein [Leptolyngbya sp. 7M]|uniref:hypothetical protein n=1 Tax=Leptolyngbya sp. 7M TaxID=2812896 RepID=UPI001B8B451A|nr:hypothetical protein [Leptolyngbya sp. 7M]QYO64037.1 hypothetical protein JVX88_30330 [Leptolyngbya sp. 7M]